MAKTKIYEAKRKFLSDQTRLKRDSVLKARSDFNQVKRKSKKACYEKEKVNLSNMAKVNPRKFWEKVRLSNSSVQKKTKLSVDDFAQYFSNISNNQETQNLRQSYDFDSNSQEIIEALDRDITTDEIKKVISSMNRNKSSDVEGNIADFFIDGKDFISPYLTSIFNFIYNSGNYPDAWTKGSIVPLFKKGDNNNPECYRGITLINITAKVFSLVLRNRLNNWCENNGVFYENQIGFRNGRSTADAIFILHTIIQKILSKNKKLWCIFIDYKRAFDTVERAALFHKLIKLGISCKFTNMIRSMYETIQSCVKLTNSTNLSEFFNVSLGLKQGEPLSPILFLLFINDITENLDFNSLNNSDLELLSKYLILFADDIVLFTTSQESLQSQVDSLYQYSCKWGLEINIEKTKVCVFEKRKSFKQQNIFTNG